VRKLQPKTEGGAGLARNTVRCMHATLRVMLQRAVKTGLLPRNPALGLGTELKLENPLEARKEIIKEQPGFDAEQLARFLSTAERVAPAFVPLFRALAFTGMRVGEALGLQWTDVNFMRHQIHVQRTLGRAGRVGSPKSRKSRRWVDMGPELEQTLTRRREGRNERRRPWLFWTQPGEPRDQRKHVRQVFARVVKAAKLPRHHVPHSLRHTYASILLAAGESAAVRPGTAWTRLA
jgi:integrase